MKTFITFVASALVLQFPAGEYTAPVFNVAEDTQKNRMSVTFKVKNEQGASLIVRDSFQTWTDNPLTNGWTKSTNSLYRLLCSLLGEKQGESLTGALHSAAMAGDRTAGRRAATAILQSLEASRGVETKFQLVWTPARDGGGNSFANVLSESYDYVVSDDEPETETGECDEADPQPAKAAEEAAPM